jgi:hypothetical protein
VPNGPGLGYAKFFNAGFTDNKLIDPNSFYIARSFNPAIGELPIIGVKITPMKPSRQLL